MDLAKGCLMGVFCGDAAGATLEFCHKHITPEIAKEAMRMPGGGLLRVCPGQLTDDSELTIHTLCGFYKAYDGPEDPSPQDILDSVAEEYIEWHKSMPFDMGTTTARAFGFAKDAKSMAENAKRYNMASEANGALMRVAPVAIAMRGAPAEEIIDTARGNALLSHPSPACQDANAIYCLAIAHLLEHRGDYSGAIKRVDAVIDRMDASVQKWYRDSSKDDLLEELNCAYSIGHVRYAMTLAFHFLRRNASIEEAVLETLQKGGDTDTNAAIVGGMMGALHGYGSIPDYMKEPVLQLDCSKCHPNTRPKKYNVQKALDMLALFLPE